MIIAETKYKISDMSGKEVSVRILCPEKMERDWACQYEIEWPERHLIRKVYGIDSAQSLVLAIYMIGTDLYSSNFNERDELLTEGKPGNFGFPVPSIIRDSVRNYKDI